MNSIILDRDGFVDAKPGEGTLLMHSGSLVRLLGQKNVKNLDYSEFTNPRPIGKGATATVYLTTSRRKNYALKSLNNNLDMDKRKLKLLSQEIINLYHAAYPNIIKLYGISREPRTGNFMLVLQYANNGSLRNYLRRKCNDGLYSISWNEICSITKGIINGLIYLHGKGIFHRNLHSNNILINDGKALISDFGIPKYLNDTSNPGAATMIAYTDPQYIIEKKSERDQKSDIYSLGVLFWELTSGVPPFQNYTVMAIYQEIIVRNNRERIIEGTPPAYVDLYVRCWSFDSNERPPLDSILYTINELEKLLESSNKFITHNLGGFDSDQNMNNHGDSPTSSNL
ncbi:kinase-like protein [Gigaspora margarita]|uniref:Kinase-like protein n=1 Tax=Gigaspora margarita TaxID=4874 RepID=A0A8H4AH00_GIGMA|nr:kinase-like protein [Gigaspora margarita]